MSRAWHVMLRARDDRVIAPSTGARRRLARVVLEIGRDHGLLAFCGADTHTHAELVCSRESAGEFARRVELALGRALHVECGFQPARLEPVRDQHHLVNAFIYVLRQRDHHGIASDPLRECSNLPDLLGARTVGLYTVTAVREYLPRITRATLLDLAGLPDLRAGSGPLDLLADAAAAAVGAERLVGREPDVVLARAAAVAVGLESAGPGEVGAALGITPRAVHKLRQRAVPPACARAIALQLGWREAARSDRARVGRVEAAGGGQVG